MIYIFILYILKKFILLFRFLRTLLIIKLIKKELFNIIKNLFHLQLVIFKLYIIHIIK